MVESRRMIVVFLSIFAFAFFGLSGTAHAWGSGAHTDFAMSIIADGAMLAPAIRHLLRRFPRHFLYGNLAADTVIGKNLADEHEHVHNWEVAIKLFDLAKDDADKAFVFGYLAHLAADTVAHNYFVPKKRVESFRTITSGHAYWELRYDSFLPRAVWEVSRSIGSTPFPQQDDILGAGLKATILDVKTNRRIWNGYVRVAGSVDRWRDLMRAHAATSPTPFEREERDEFRALALEAVACFLNDLRESKTFVADPTGRGNLGAAWKIGAHLRKGTSKGIIDPREADEIAMTVAKSLRESLHVAREADLSTALVRV